MQTWFISDLHFGHTNVLKYDSAPYGNIEEHDEDIIRKWNETVKNDDIVYLLGDICLTSNKERIRGWVSRLKGRKRLVLGNHDRRHDLKFYYEIGFERVYDKPVILKNFFILSHEPVYLTENMPYYNIYGHVHVHPSFATETPQSFCVCCCRHGYKPVVCAAWDNYNPEEHPQVIDF